MALLPLYLASCLAFPRKTQSDLSPVVARRSRHQPFLTSAVFARHGGRTSGQIERAKEEKRKGTKQ